MPASGAPPLVAAGSAPGFVGPLAVPGDLYWVLREPAPLAGMAYPRGAVWRALSDAGFHHVVCLTHDAPRYDAAPMTAHAYRLQDLVVKRRPRHATREEEIVRRAAARVVELHRGGEGVVVHCHGGRGRAGTVLGVALVELGHDPDVVVRWMHAVQRTRGRRGWPESPWQEAVVRATEAGAR